MNCNLTDKEREDGSRCRSFECTNCREFSKQKASTPITITGTLSIHDGTPTLNNVAFSKDLEIESLEKEIFVHANTMHGKEDLSNVVGLLKLFKHGDHLMGKVKLIEPGKMYFEDKNLAEASYISMVCVVADAGMVKEEDGVTTVNSLKYTHAVMALNHSDRRIKPLSSWEIVEEQKII